MFIKWYSMNSIKKISGIRCNSNPNKGPGARAGHFPSFFSLFYNAKNPFFRKIHSFSKPVPLPPVRKS